MKVGDKVRISVPSYEKRTGVVVRLYPPPVTSIAVRPDGLKGVQKYHRDFIKKIRSKG